LIATFLFFVSGLVSLLLNFRLTFSSNDTVLFYFDNSLFGGHLVKESQALDHGVDLLVISRHELLLEGPLGGQVQGLKQILLTTFVYFSRVIGHSDSLLLFERQLLLDRIRNVQSSEHSLTSFLVQGFVVMGVGRVRLLRDGKVALSAQLGVGLEHPSVAISDNRVAETGDVNSVPSAGED